MCESVRDFDFPDSHSKCGGTCIDINGSATVGREAHTVTKLGSKVELRGSKHPMVDIQKTDTACEKWFDPTEMHEVYLCTDRTASDAVGVCGSATSATGTASNTHRTLAELRHHFMHFSHVTERTTGMPKIGGRGVLRISENADSFAETVQRC